jgi:hypothetical protein
MSEVKIENWIYIGPTVARIGLKKSTLVLGSTPPPQLLSLMELKPVIKSLFIPTAKTAEARSRMRIKGTLENIAAEEIIKFGREKIERERIVVKTERKL